VNFKASRVSSEVIGTEKTQTPPTKPTKLNGCGRENRTPKVEAPAIRSIFQGSIFTRKYGL
jgi:hypothetical protein